MIDKHLTVLNDGKDTRVNRNTGGKSTPDVSLAGRKWCNMCTWSVGEQLSKSDHLPITITINEETSHQSVFGKTARWKRSGANWKEFRDEVEQNCQNLPQEFNITSRATRFTDILLAAGYKFVGKSKPGPRTKSFMTPTVRAALRKRNRLPKGSSQPAPGMGGCLRRGP